MLTAKKILSIFMGMSLCSLVLLGCSEDQGKKQEKKIETTQERLGREAAENLQKPMEDARKAAQLGTERVQTLSEAAQKMEPPPQEGGATPQARTKEKKKLEGC